MESSRIAQVRLVPVDIPLTEAFGISTGAQEVARNLFVEVELQDGTVGTGEAAPFPAVNGETREMAQAALERVVPSLTGKNVRTWRALAESLGDVLLGAPSSRCALETAILDALTLQLGVPLHVFLGGHQHTLETDLTITTGTLKHVRDAAMRIARLGYRTIKLKVGGIPVEQDIARLLAVREAAPACSLILDANGAMDGVAESVELLKAAARAGAHVVLFEQPFKRGAYAQSSELVSRRLVPVAADEDATSEADVVRLAKAGAADVINVKATKCGVVEGLRMLETARALGLKRMVGGMVESRLCAGVGAAMAAGLGGVEFVDLDTPLWMVESPVVGGYAQDGRVLDLAGITAGHGCRLK